MNQATDNLYDRIKKASNWEYNLGLTKARERDLSNAIHHLQKALRLNKHNTSARNLLGLVYYELGEVVEALSQWVISKNLDGKLNRADHFLSQIQAKPNQIENANQNIRKYNQALSYASKGSEDLAILQMQYVVSRNPNFVKGHQLLALLYLHKKEYDKVSDSLNKLLQIDKKNAVALRYQEELKDIMQSSRKLRRKEHQLTSLRKEEEIKPLVYRENTGWQIVVNILIGLGLGVAVMFFLVFPTINQQTSKENRKLILEYNDKITAKENEIEQLQAQMGSLEAAKVAAEGNLEQYTDSSSGIVAEYNFLLQAQTEYMASHRLEAFNFLAMIHPDRINDPVFLSVYQNLREVAQSDGWRYLTDAGKQALNQQDIEKARDYLTKSLSFTVHEDTLYSLGYALELMGDIASASGYYQQAIDLKPNSTSGKKAKQRMALLQTPTQ
ncbi:hypothetical protein FACS189418_2500 [Clostridia bacterium]|nr:hypothetical protein FACS189418_2500 [Clostridia bacterium]